MLGLDGLVDLAVVAGVGVAVVGGVETLDNELETRRGAVAVLEAGAMIFVSVSNLSLLKHYL